MFCGVCVLDYLWKRRRRRRRSCVVDGEEGSESFYQVNSEG